MEFDKKFNFAESGIILPVLYISFMFSMTSIKDVKMQTQTQTAHFLSLVQKQYRLSSYSWNIQMELL